MKTIKRFICMFTIFIMGICCYGCSANKNETDYKLPNVTIGNEFNIVMDAATGSYSWKYDLDKNDGIKYVTMKFTPSDDDTNKLGGGTIVYTFLATKEGNYKIKFILQETWSSNPPLETRIYSVTVVEQ